ncbi:MAG: hypothetical protein ACXAB7_05930 [Candidatus Kariarchaeaceae archaeon]|jgi:hypothetical protein
MATPSLPDNVQDNKIIPSGAIASGTINGIDWEYGTYDFFESGNITQEYNDTLFEHEEKTFTYTADIDLITNQTFSDVVYSIDWNFTVDDPEANLTEYNNATFFDLIIFVNNTMALRLDGTGNVTHGRELLDLTVHENHTVVVSDAVGFNGTDYTFLGRFPTNTTYVEYNHKFANNTVVRRSGLIAAKYIIFDIEQEVHTVNVEHIEITQAWMGFYSRYSMAYNVSATAHYVNITDGANFGLHVTMFDEIQANYTQVAVTWVGYDFKNINFYNLTFTNGTPVDWGMYPKSMLPTAYNKSGIIVEAGYQQVSSRLLSTYQSVVAAFAQVDVDIGTLATDDVSIEAKLAVWGVQTSPTMIAYVDGNRNRKLDLTLDDDGLTVDPVDKVSFLGLAEAYQTTVFNARYESARYNESVEFHGMGVKIENPEVNETVYYDGWATFGTIGFDPDATINSNFVWSAPSEETDGTVMFGFGMDYTNFPVTWVNVTDTSAFIEPTNIGYHYIVTVDPETGKAKISTTWIFDGITDPVNNAKMDRLSLALIVKSEFFALRVAYTATQSNDTIDTSRSRRFGRLAIASGGGNSAEIDVTGPKASYLWDGRETVPASFDAINLLKVSGHFREEKETPFVSESENTAGAANVDGVVERLSIDFFYSASLIIVSYPKWGGEGIVHDPDFNVNYQPLKLDTVETTTSETTSDTESTTSSSTTKPPASSSSEGEKVPGFSALIALTAFLLVPIIRRRK